VNPISIPNPDKVSIPTHQHQSSSSSNKVAIEKSQRNLSETREIVKIETAAPLSGN